MGRKAPSIDHKFCSYCGALVEKYLSLDEVANLTSMSVEFWRARIKARDIDYVKIGRSVRIPHSSLKSMIQLVPAINTQTIHKSEIE